MKNTFTVALTCLVLAGGPAAAKGMHAPAGAPATEASEIVTSPPAAATGVTQPADAVAEEGVIDGFNRVMHGFNLWVWKTTDTGTSWASFLAPPVAVREATSNLLLNYVNEPLSMLSWAVAGDYGNVSTAARRFWINTTEGWLGAEDVASEQGVKVPQIDIGLALCARGVGEGGYIVLPFVGPRTYRDGLSDFLLINGLTYLALAPAVGFPPSPSSIAVIEVTEEAGRIAVMRQIDHGEDRNASLTDVRDKYLASRRQRCSDIIAARDQAVVPKASE